MVIIALNNTEALYFKEVLKGVADKVEKEALKEHRPPNPKEELVLNACVECFMQIEQQIDAISKKALAEEEAEFNRQFREDTDRQAKQN